MVVPSFVNVVGSAAEQADTARIPLSWSHSINADVVAVAEAVQAVPLNFGQGQNLVALGSMEQQAAVISFIRGDLGLVAHGSKSHQLTRSYLPKYLQPTLFRYVLIGSFCGRRVLKTGDPSSEVSLQFGDLLCFVRAGEQADVLQIPQGTPERIQDHAISSVAGELRHLSW